MNEMFHTEDCGVSLICRCCRGPACERRQTRSERMSVPRDLWPHCAPQHVQRFSMRNATRRLRGFFRCLTLGLFRSADWCYPAAILAVLYRLS